MLTRFRSLLNRAVSGGAGSLCQPPTSVLLQIEVGPTTTEEALAKTRLTPVSVATGNPLTFVLGIGFVDLEAGGDFEEPAGG